MNLEIAGSRKITSQPSSSGVRRFLPIIRLFAAGFPTISCRMLSHPSGCCTAKRGRILGARIESTTWLVETNTSQARRSRTAFAVRTGLEARTERKSR